MVRVNPYERHKADYLKLKDKNCCTVVTLAEVTGNNYIQCFSYMSKYGRCKGRGATKSQWNAALEGMQKFKAVKGDYSQQNRITIKEFIQKHPKGIYYCANNGHAFAIKNGILYDHTDGWRRQITCAYRIYTQEELKILRGDK